MVAVSDFWASVTLKVCYVAEAPESPVCLGEPGPMPLYWKAAPLSGCRECHGQRQHETELGAAPGGSGRPKGPARPKGPSGREPSRLRQRSPCCRSRCGAAPLVSERTSWLHGPPGHMRHTPRHIMPNAKFGSLWKERLLKSEAWLWVFYVPGLSFQTSPVHMA